MQYNGMLKSLAETSSSSSCPSGLYSPIDIYLPIKYKSKFLPVEIWNINSILEFAVEKKFKITGDVVVEKVRDGFLKVTDDYGTVKVLGKTYQMSTIYIKSPSEHAVSCGQFQTDFNQSIRLWGILLRWSYRLEVKIPKERELHLYLL
jgi:hypothetical protein